MGDSFAPNEHEISRLKLFHQTHFPNQRIPPLEQAQTTNQPTSSVHPNGADEDALGYYEDGVKRTLTDAQIAMFRNSEIHKIVRERQRAADREEALKQEQETVHHHDQANGHRSGKWTKHFDEAAKTVDTLMYDDEPGETAQPTVGQQKFLWPTLG